MCLFRGGREVLAETRAHDYMPAPAGGMSASEGLRRDLPTAGDNATLFVFFCTFVDILTKYSLYRHMTDAAPIIVLVAILVVLWLFWIHIPANMARNRGRSALGWVLLAWVLSPLWIIIILLILGDSKEKLSKDIIDQLKQK